MKVRYRYGRYAYRYLDCVLVSVHHNSMLLIRIRPGPNYFTGSGFNQKKCIDSQDWFFVSSFYKVFV